MGEVYRAHDNSSAETSRSSSCPGFPRTIRSASRDSSEARILAALNHPHIGAIYGLEQMDGSPALVLEFVEGETLAERIARKGRALGSGNWHRIARRSPERSSHNGATDCGGTRSRARTQHRPS